MKKQPLKYRLNIVGASIIIFLIIRTFIPPLFLKAGLNKNLDILLLAYIILRASSCIIPIAFIENMCDFHPYVFGKRGNMKNAPAIVMSSMLLFIMTAVLNRMLLWPLGKIGIVFPAQTLPPIRTPLNFILYYIFCSILPAIFEELYMRGTVMNLLMPHGRKFAILASAFLFMILHTQVQSFLSVFIAGITLACAYLYTDNIYIPMFIHCANNTYSFLIMYMRQKVNGISQVSFSVYLISFIITCGIASIMYLSRNKINIYSAYSQGTKPAHFRRLFASPILVLAMIACLMAAFEQAYNVLVK